jgi:KDO2-lipid IV(A) lauroyltransferase
MSLNRLFQSRLSVQLSIIIGKYLPRKVGYKVASVLGSLFASIKSLELNQAVRLNQFIANGMVNTSDELIEKNKQILIHAGKCFIDLYQYFGNQDILESLVPFSSEMQDFIELCQKNQGYMVVAPHLSNFDLVALALVQKGFDGKVISYPNPGSNYQLQNEIRRSLGMDLVPLDSPNLERELIDHLKNGGVAATGIDRPVPGRKKRHYLNFFGHPSPLQVGYIQTALAANVPIIVVTAIMNPDGSYGFKHSGPIELKRYNNKLDEIKLNAEMVLKVVEDFIKLAPEQWLMFYPVWPDLQQEVL